MRKILSLILIIFLLSFVSAIRINEVELNPTGADSGNEWIEFYNNEEISLEGYTIVNGDGKNLSLNGSFDGYFVYNLAKQWLDNSNESIFLYKNTELTDKVISLDDSKNNDFTYQFCSSSWEFMNSTKGSNNNCPEQNSETEQINETDNPEETNEIVSTDIGTEDQGTPQSTHVNSIPAINNTAKITEKPITADVIQLNPQPKDIKSEVNVLTSDKIAIYSLVAFCILLGVLFAAKKLKKHKTEFEIRT